MALVSFELRSSTATQAGNSGHAIPAPSIGLKVLLPHLLQAKCLADACLVLTNVGGRRAMSQGFLYHISPLGPRHSRTILLGVFMSIKSKTFGPPMLVAIRRRTFSWIEWLLGVSRSQSTITRPFASLRGIRQIDGERSDSRSSDSRIELNEPSIDNSCNFVKETGRNSLLQCCSHTIDVVKHMPPFTLTTGLD